MIAPSNYSNTARARRYPAPQVGLATRRGLITAAAASAAAVAAPPVFGQRPTGAGAAAAPAAPAAATAPLSLGGSTLVESIVKAWALRNLGSDTYAAVGSGEGVERLQAGSLDISFADFALTEVALRAKKLVQVPVMADAVAVAYNLPGSDGLQLSADALADIYMGSLRDWSRSQVAALNPSFKSAPLAIQPYGRSDPSGASLAFLSFLARRNRSVAKEIGAGLIGRYPNHVRSVRGDAGMATEVKRLRGSLGYMGLAQARAGGLQVARLRLDGTTTVAPSAASIAAMLSAAVWDANTGAADVERTRAEGAWPLTFVIYATFAAGSGNSARCRDFLRFVNSSGAADVGRLGFVDLPAKARALATARLAVAA